MAVKLKSGKSQYTIDIYPNDNDNNKSTVHANRAI